MAGEAGEASEASTDAENRNFFEIRELTLGRSMAKNAAAVDASLADLGEISRREQRDVRVQCARLEHGVVPG